MGGARRCAKKRLFTRKQFGQRFCFEFQCRADLWKRFARLQVLNLCAGEQIERRKIISRSCRDGVNA